MLLLRRIISTLALGVTLGIPSVVLAQSENPNVNRPPQKPPTDTPPNTNQPPSDRQRERQEERQRERERAAADLPASFFRASELIGMRVDAKGGEKIGDIRNLAVNAETGRVRYVIVENGGTLYPIPASAVNFSRQRATVDTTPDRMKDAPTFKPDGWDTIGDASWGEKVFQFYGINRNADDSKERPDFVPVNAVVGARAETRKGDNLGTVKDLMVDTDKDAVAYVALEGGNNARLFAIPWQSANFNDNGKRVVVRGLERDDLRDGPGFPNNRWPTYRELNWDTNTNFDSRPPRWVYGTNETGNGGGNNGGGGGGNNNNNDDRGELGGWQTNSKYGQLFRSNRVDRWNGTIVRTESVTPMSGMDPGTALVVRTNQGNNIVVHLGPEWFIRHQQGTFGDGTEIEVAGSQVDIDQKQAVMATHIRINGRTMTLRDSDGVPVWDAWQERGGGNNNRGNATGNPNQGNPGRGNDNNRGNAGNKDNPK